MVERIAGTIALILLAASCSPSEYEQVSGYPPIFPDYVCVTVPEGIANLNFDMADGSRCKVDSKRSGDTLWFEVSAWNRGDRKGRRYDAFPVFISHDPVDPYIAYRLIEPGYESWNLMGIYARELSSYREHPVLTNKVNGGGCINCHTFSGGDPGRMLFHARGKGGGTVIVGDSAARLVNLAQTGPHRQGTYPAWHPSGRYVAFSSNTTLQCFSIDDSQPVEVYDTSSDIILMDLQTDSVTIHPALDTPGALETFPAWNPDGSRLYYCAADTVGALPRNRADLHYRLMSIDFEDGRFTGEPREVFRCDSLSVSFPRIYGNTLMFTASAYATFPIWHREADLWTLDLETGAASPAEELNSPDTESYHSWSSNGKWVIFSSRRIDGRYTRLFIAHVREDGTFSKPFLLPQRKASHNTQRLKSYNIPEFIKGDPGDLRKEVGKLFGK